MLTPSEVVFYVLFAITVLYSVGLFVYMARVKRAASTPADNPLRLLVKEWDDRSEAFTPMVESVPVEALVAKREAPTPKFRPFHEATSHPEVSDPRTPQDESECSSVIVSQGVEADHYPRTEENLEEQSPRSEWVATSLSSLSEAEMDYLFEDEEVPTPNLEVVEEAQTRRLKISDIPSYSLLMTSGEAASDTQTRQGLEGELPDYGTLFGVRAPEETEGVTTRELQINDLSSYSKHVIDSRRDQTINAENGGHDEG